MDWGTMSPTERDAAYNSSAAVSESAQFVARWTEASRQWRAEHSNYLDIPYGTKERTKWDIFPGSKPDMPCLIHIHGGYWQRNSKEVFSCLARGVAAHGWPVALPGYTLAPDASLSEIVTECRAALDWFGENRQAYGIRGPLILSGWSAGAQLAALLLDHPSISAGFAISGVYELGPLRDTQFNDKLQLSDAEVSMLSPLRLEPSHKPLTIVYGTRELAALVENSRAYHEKRSAAHRTGALIPVPGANHFDILESLLNPDGLLTRSVLRLAEDLGA